MITASNLAIQFGPKPLFENVNVKFGEGNRYGLIGANGSGKSTLMKIIGGDLESTAGNVHLEPGLRLGKLRQDQFAFEDYRVLDVVLMGHTEMWEAMSERDAIYANAESTDEDYMRAADLEAKFAEYDGYTAEARAGELLLGLEFPVEQHQLPMREIAPGWKLRVLLAQALFSNPDVLLLDEPTNNLDINTIRWLENVLNGYQSTMIIISHDRHFLNQVCTHMADLDFGELRVYPGNYDDYMLASTQARERVSSANAKAKERVSELQDFVRRFSANKSKARQATSRLKQIDRIKAAQVEVKPSSRQNPFIRFEQNKILHRQAVTLDVVEKAFDAPVIRPFSAMVEAAEKIAIIGANGAGKTTLLRMLALDLKPDRGLIKWAENADLGYMAQDVSELFTDKDSNLFEWMTHYRQPTDDDQSIRSVLGRLLFSADDLPKAPSVLSGGEKNRMTFGRLMLRRHNVMLLDEPTNHLDMESIESLQLALDKYPGTLFFVSHDREFVSALATRIWEIQPDGQVTDYRGPYEEYLASKGIENEANMIVLGFESSCDETGVALVCTERGLLAHALHSQVAMHAAYGGVVPELASRDHVRRVIPLTRTVLQDAGLTLEQVGAVAYTAGPGLAGALLVGASVAQSIAWSLDLPAIPIHHLEGHLLSPRMADPCPAFPFVALLVSGGHTQLMKVDDVGSYTLLGETLDDAAGEAFDKTAKLLGLGYPGGPALARLAEQGNAEAISLPRPMLHSGNLDFSFSGLKTAVLTRLKDAQAASVVSQTLAADLAAATQDAIVDVLIAKSIAALDQTGLKRLVVAGGVGANRILRSRLAAKLVKRHAEVFFPPLALCTDNGAMIAFAAAQRIERGLADLDSGRHGFDVRPRWDLATI